MKDSNSIRPFVLSVLWLLASLLSSSVAYAQTCVSPPSGLVSWWPLDDTSGTTAADIIGTNPGMHVNEPTPVVGNVAGALSFDGVNDFVIFGTSTGNFGTSDFTIDWWMKTSLSLSVRQSVISKRAVCGAVNFYDVRMVAGTLRIEIRQATPTSIIGNVVSASAVDDGQYHHIAVVRQGVTSRIYVDGVLEATTAASGVINVNNTAEFTAGRSPCTGVDGTATYEGELDEIGTLNKALSTSEIQAIFNAGSAGKCKSNLLPVELVSFEAVADADAVVLDWRTASETNNAGFEIQRRSNNVGATPASPQDWTVLGFVEGHGTTSEPQPYRYRVDALESGRHRFRLKQLDFDGSLAYSPEVEVFVALPEAFLLTAAYPNPFTPSTSFSLMVKRRQQVQVAIYDALGRLVRTLYQGRMEAEQARAIRFEAGDSPSGLYVIRAFGETFTATRKVMLIR